jgi:hypothetical protein
VYAPGTTRHGTGAADRSHMHAVHDGTAACSPASAMKRTNAAGSASPSRSAAVTSFAGPAAPRARPGRFGVSQFVNSPVNRASSSGGTPSYG